MPTDLLFTYGTLMRGFPLHRLLEGVTEYVGAGQVTARLVDLGPYPGAIPDAQGCVRGEVYRVTRPGAWAVLDSVEGPQYHRREVTVRMDGDRAAAAHIYWYVGPVDRTVPVPGGDYRAHGPARSIHLRSRVGPESPGGD
jgi:gamma-glutamylcyclotransferase (GGCT)/AIG2-like uncharacterized protein YtfP